MKNVSKSIDDPVRLQYEQYPYPDIDPQTENPTMLVSCHLSLMCDLLWAGKKSPQGLRVLDAGCGTGSPLAAMARAYPQADITGIDFSAGSLEKARQLAQRLELKNVRFYQAAIEKVGELGLEFDFIISSGVLHHLQDPAQGLAALKSVLAPDGAISIMLYGKYGRAGIYMLQEALKLVFPPAPENSKAQPSGNDESAPDRIEHARRLAAALPLSHPFSVRKQGREITEGKAAGIVDLLLHARDIPFDAAAIFKMCKKAGMQFYRWLFPIIYEPETYIKDPSLTCYFEKLALLDRYRLAELVHGHISKHSFFVVKPGFPDPRTGIARGNWRNLRAYLTPCLKWSQVAPVLTKPGMFTIPPAVIQDEWDSLQLAEWELFFLSRIQPEVRLGQVIEEPSVRGLLPFKTREAVDAGVEALLKKALDMLAIVLLE